ncbi:MAG: hypothetical protein QOF98_931, partial [Streptomyces sp.]|nr:hypothetical protein [Streptomyces sp.]
GAGAALAAALKEARVHRATRGAAEPVFIRIDPPDIG